MKGMILAAGFGTRFRPATYEIPKPMIPLCNRPLIGWALEAMFAAGIREIVVNLHHLPEALERHLLDQYGREADFAFSKEESILGTGGGIRRARRFLGDDIFVLANGDTVHSPPFAELVSLCRREKALAALLLRHPPANDRFTKVFFDGRSIRGFGEGGGEALMFAGAHAISPEIFEMLPDRDFSGITEDVYIPAVRAGSGPLAGLVHDGHWFDIGTPRRYLEATEEVRALMLEGKLAVPRGSAGKGNSIVAGSAEIRDSLESSVAGDRSRVESGARVRDSVLWEGAEVGEGAVVERSIVARDVQIPRGATVRGALICRRLEDVDYPEGTIVRERVVATGISEGEAPVLERIE